MFESISKMVCQRHPRMLVWVFAALTVPASLVQPAEIEGVRFPEQLQMGEAQLKLQGTGLLKYRAVFKAYVAALYLDEGATADEVFDEIPRRLEIEYFWSVPAHRFVDATHRGIARNVDGEEFQALQARIAQFNAFYSDIEPGDRYSVTYLPGRGTELALNGEPVGVVEGADFSTALFSIWLGPNPLDAGLRRDLLARR